MYQNARTDAADLDFGSKGKDPNEKGLLLDVVPNPFSKVETVVKGIYRALW